MDDMATDDEAYYSAPDDMNYLVTNDMNYPAMDGTDYPMDDVDYPAVDNVDYPAVDNVDYPAVDNMDHPADEEHDDNRISMKLRQFCHQAKDLLSRDQTAFVSFVLTGKDADGSQACVDPIFNRLSSNHRLRTYRDYDSVLGIHSDILVNANITVYPISRRDDTLSHSIHIRHEFTRAGVSFLIVCSN